MARRSHAPTCGTCATVCRLTSGAEVYPYRPDLTDAPIYKCDTCGGTVGCHKGTKRPLGTPAGPVLRHARQTLHGKLDPIWRFAETCYPDAELGDRLAVHRLRATARSRVYKFLADRMGLDVKACHVGMFDLDQCRLAYKIVRSLKYETVRAWVHATRAPEPATQEPDPMTREQFRKAYRAFREMKDTGHPDGIFLDTGRIYFEQLPYQFRRISHRFAPKYSTAFFVGAVAGYKTHLRRFNIEQLRTRPAIRLP